MTAAQRLHTDVGMTDTNLRFWETDEFSDADRLQPVGGGESRSGQFTGTKALMLAVLEDGIRSYLGGRRIVADEAEIWILSRRRSSPFCFDIVCETLGLNPDAVRTRIKCMKRDNPSRRTLRRSRHNVRIPGRVAA